MNYQKPKPFKPGSVAQKGEVRGGESEKAPAESTVLMRSSADMGRSEKFHGFKG